MPTSEANVHALLIADTAWKAIFTGGTYLASKIGIEGIGIKSSPAAYDAKGKLKPAALVRQRALIPTGFIRDLAEKVADASQTVEIYSYQSVQTDAIEAGLVRGYQLLEGHVFTACLPAEWTLTFGIVPEPGSLAPLVMMARQDWLIRSLRKGA